MKILPLYFFSALCFGFMLLYIVFPKPKVVLRQPHPSNAGDVLYVDDSNVCYRYHKEEVACSETK